MTCANCGKDIPEFDPRGMLVEDEMNASHCDECNDSFYEHMARQYPFGQCHECGADGIPLRCTQGKTHVIFQHSEGGCSQWSDSGDADYDSFCGFGCPLPIIERPKVPVDDDYELLF